MYATVRTNHYRKVIERPRVFIHLRCILLYSVSFFEDALSFTDNSGASLALRNVSFRRSILVSSSPHLAIKLENKNF